MVRRFEQDWEIIILNQINLDNFSEQQKRKIGQTWNNMLNEFYLNPENEKKFQKWLKNKQKNCPIL